MAGIRSSTWGRPLHIFPPINRVRVDGFCCCSTASNGKSKETQTPKLLKIAVGGVTELLRLLLPAGRRRAVLDDEAKERVTVSDVNDIISIIRYDYEKAYFVTGLFTSSIYAEDCIFEDPTIKFQDMGWTKKESVQAVMRRREYIATNASTELYARNLSLLLPFLDSPSIQLKEIHKGLDSETEFLVASWKLRTYLKLPWRPLILIDGTTTYDLDEELRIVKHVERWSVSAAEAILQIFTPSSGNPDQ